MLGRDFVAWAGRRLIGAAALVALGGFVEGMTIVMLVPVIGLLLATPGAEGPGSTLAGAVEALPGPPETRFALVVAAFAAILCVRFLILHVRDMTMARLEQDFVAALRLRFFRQMAHAPWSEAAALGRGRVGHALSRDIDRAGVSVSALLRGGSAVFMLAVQLGIAFWLAPFVTLVVMALGAAAFAALRPLRARAYAAGGGVTRDDYELFSGISGFLRGLKSAKAHGLEDSYLASLERAATGYGERLIAVRRDISLGTLALQTAAGGLALVAVYVGHTQFALAPEVLVVLILVMARIGAPLQSIQLAIQSMHFGQAAYASARDEIGQRLSVSAAPPAAAQPWPAPPGLVVDGVRHLGEGGSVILEGIDAEVPAGAVTAITGPSGSGKTTLCDLLVGLEQPQTGRILIDGAPLDGRARARAARITAYVGQDDTLGEETLRANLTLGAPPGTIDDAAIWSALATTGAEALVRRSDSGLDGRLRNEAGRFSGGERQRIRLARAILRRPKFLILDEATSALDLDAEIAVLRAVFCAVAGATVVFVTHRAGAADLAEHRIRLAGGRIA